MSAGVATYGCGALEMVMNDSDEIVMKKGDE